MKRRNFLTATGIVFASSVASNVTAATSTFNSFSSQVSLNELSDNSKKALENFVGALEIGFGEHPDKAKFVKNVAMPVRIITKKSKNGVETISYKNRNAEYIKISIEKGVESIYISKSPFKV